MSGFLKHFDFEEGKQNLATKFVPTYKLGISYWPYANFIAYQFFPFHLRQPVIDVLAYIYAVALSFLINQKLNL